MSFSQRTHWPLAPNRLSVLLNRLRHSGEAILDLAQTNPARCGFSYLKEDLLKPFLQEENLRYDPSPRGARGSREAIAEYYQTKAKKGRGRKGPRGPRPSAGWSDSLSPFSRVDPEAIFLTAGTSEAYSWLFHLLADPGDEILIPKPSYPLLDFLGALADVCLKSYRLILEEQREGKQGTGWSNSLSPVFCPFFWRIDLEGLEKAISPRTKAIVLIHPNNPTGSFVKKDELSFLNRLARERSLALIVDEVFSDYFFEEDQKQGTGLGDGVEVKQGTGWSDSLSPVSLRVDSTVSNEEALTFTLNGISKMLGLPQMKVGWVVTSGPNELVHQARERLEVIADTYLSVNTPSQNALPKWMALREGIQQEIRGRVIRNFQFLWKRISAIETKGTGRKGPRGPRPFAGWGDRREKGDRLGQQPVPFLLPFEGGWSSILTVPESKTDEEWAIDLLEKERVLVNPGYLYDFDQDPVLVLSLLPQEEVFEEGIERIGKMVTRGY